MAHTAISGGTTGSTRTESSDGLTKACGGPWYLRCW